MKPPLPRVILLAACCLGVLSAVTFAGDDLKLVVSAGNHDRENTPVSVLVEVPAEAKGVTLTAPDGKRIAGQLTAPGVLNEPAQGKRELHFILPGLKKGQSITLKASLSTDAPKAQGFAWEQKPDEYAELSCGDQPVLRYMCLPYDDSTGEKRHDTFKVFHHLFSPSGDRLVTKGPGGRYTHHRGLFFGYCHCSFDGKRVDTWGCGSGHQVHAGFLDEEAGPVLGRHRVAVEWRANDGTTFVREERELTAYLVPGAALVEFASRVSSARGKVTLDGNAPHAGFQFRADQEVAEKTEKLTYYLRPDGKGELGKARGSAKDLPWDAISFVLGADRYTVVYLDKPTNPKPAEYNERTYGRFGSYFKYELDEGKDLVPNYRIWLQDGEMTVEQAQALSNDFVDPVEVTVKY